MLNFEIHISMYKYIKVQVHHIPQLTIQNIREYLAAKQHDAKTISSALYISRGYYQTTNTNEKVKLNPTKVGHFSAL